MFISTVKNVNLRMDKHFGFGKGFLEETFRFENKNSATRVLQGEKWICWFTEMQDSKKKKSF